MTQRARLWNVWIAGVTLAVGLPFGWHAVGSLLADAPQAQLATSIPSLSEPGEGLEIRDRSERTGLVSFAASAGRGILVSVQANAPTETRARSFVAQYGAVFGVSDQGLRLARQPERDALGIEHTRFLQQHNDVPVTAGEFFVHLRGSRVMSANGRILPDDRMPDTTPQIALTQAIETARALVATKHAGGSAAQYSLPRLEIFNRGLLEDGDFPSHLTWFVEAVGPALREFIWVDAHMGGLVFHFSQRPHAKNRAIYDANNNVTLPGTLRRVESGPATGDVEEDGLYEMLGATYDYFLAEHGRDSFDGAGAQIIGSVDWIDPADALSCPNAFWNGTQIAFCNGLVADDVVHHEYTHAVTQFTARLFYFNQSGALNESYSDIFGETIDQTDGIGNDTAGVKWGMGEDSSTGIIRNMMTPTLFNHPGKMSDTQFQCNPLFDAGGIHTNSGIPNHAYALMVDGGTYNGHTITGIGLTKAGKIQYRALSVYLSSGSNFKDNYNAVNQACTDLIGTSGITASDCTQVNSALRAVEMTAKPICTNYTSPPPLCTNGAAPASTLFFDDFESPPVAWEASSTTGSNWLWAFGWGRGVYHAYGPATAFTSDHRMSMASSVAIPANARMYFEHAFFHQSPSDGSVLEYSTNGGSTWTLAGSLIDGGQAFNTVLDFSNPIGSTLAFSGDSYGFTATRLNLSSLAGQSVRFRFRVGNNSTIAYTGWVVDNVRIYTCPGNVTGEMILNGGFTSGGTPPAPPANWTTFSSGTGMVWDTNGGTFNYQRPAGNTQGVVFQQTGIALPAFTVLISTFNMANTDPGRKRFSVLIHDADFSDLSVCTFWLDGSAPQRTYTMRTHTTKAWTNATISIYAATVGSNGFYQLDNVSMQIGPLPLGPVGRGSGVLVGSTEMTECVDPVTAPCCGVLGADLLVNGAFGGGTIAPWGTVGNIQSQLSAGGVFEFFKLAGLPAGVLLQSTGQAMTNDQKLRVSFQLGNSSNVRQRVTVLLHDSDFSDLHACTFFLPPGLPLSTYAVRTYTTKAWTNATLSFYPSTPGTAPTTQWLQLDNVSLVRTGTTTIGTECFEPGEVPSAPGIAVARAMGGRGGSRGGLSMR